MLGPTAHAPAAMPVLMSFLLRGGVLQKAPIERTSAAESFWIISTTSSSS
jgi:hypothetical protein